MTKKILIAASILFLIRAAAAWFLPIMRDEAYYTLWAQNLAFGYLDHPPLVAFATTGILLEPSNPFAARLGSLLFAAGSIYLFVRTCYIAGLTGVNTTLVALLLGQGGFAAIASGFLATPDAGLAFAWILALHEGLAALLTNPKRWISAGLAVGLGLLSKYHMVLMMGVFFWTLWMHQRHSLRTKWPWLGVLAAVLVFLPNIQWNASNSWLTMRYQLAHGFGVERSSLVQGLLPSAIDDQDGSIEYQVGNKFAEADAGVTKKKEKKKKKVRPLPERILNRVIDFTSGQMALWGALLLPIGIAVFRRKKIFGRWKGAFREPFISTLRPETRSLLISATLIPLLFFGSIGLASKIEANWPAMYMVSAAILLALISASQIRIVAMCVIFNTVVIAAGVLHARTRLFSGAGEGDRLLNETAGYPELVEHLTNQNRPVFVDTFQNMSVLKFINPSLQVSQWPGITRPSEFTITASYYPESVTKLVGSGFTLVTDQSTPPRIPGYFPSNMVELRHCLGNKIEIVDLKSLQMAQVFCKEARRTWRQIEYAPY